MLYWVKQNLVSVKKREQITNLRYSPKFLLNTTKMRYTGTTNMWTINGIMLCHYHPAGNYMFKVNNGNTRTRCEICSKLTIKIPEWRRAAFSHCELIRWRSLSMQQKSDLRTETIILKNFHCAKNEVRIIDFFSKCDQIHRKHLLKKSFMENLFFV